MARQLEIPISQREEKRKDSVRTGYQDYET